MMGNKFTGTEHGWLINTTQTCCYSRRQHQRNYMRTWNRCV